MDDYQNQSSSDENVSICINNENHEASEQQGIRRRRKQQACVISQHKRMKLSDLEPPQYPIWGKVRNQKYLFENAPITNKIAQSGDRLDALWDEHCGYSKAEFNRIRNILIKCMKLMYCEGLGYIYGAEAAAEMKIFLRQRWTIKSTMTSDGMPIYERDTIFSILEMIEKHVASGGKDILALFNRLQEVCEGHFGKRKQAGPYRSMKYIEEKNKETKQEQKKVKNAETQVMGQLLHKLKHLGRSKQKDKESEISVDKKESKDTSTQLSFFLGEQFGKSKDVCAVKILHPEKVKHRQQQQNQQPLLENQQPVQQNQQPLLQSQQPLQQNQQPLLQNQQPLLQNQQQQSTSRPSFVRPYLPFRFRPDLFARPADDSESDDNSGPLFPEDDSDTLEDLP